MLSNELYKTHGLTHHFLGLFAVSLLLLPAGFGQCLLVGLDALCRACQRVGDHFHHGVNAAVIHLDDVLFLEVCHEYSHEGQW